MNITICKQLTILISIISESSITLYYVHVVTLGIGSIIQYKLSMSEIIQNWFKVHWTSIK